jgi:hypothetical protein
MLSDHVSIISILLTTRGGNGGPKTGPIRRHMAMFMFSNHVIQLSLYVSDQQNYVIMPHAKQESCNPHAQYAGWQPGNPVGLCLL